MMLKSLFILPKSLRIAEDIREWGGDHVHAAYAGHPATCAWIVRRATGVPFSVSCHAHDIFETQALLSTKLPEADFVRTISEYNRRYILRHVPALASKPPVIIHVGAFLESITPSTLYPSDRLHVLYVGSLEYRKGVDVLLRALSQARLGEWRLDILGGGPERSRLEALSADLGLTDRVTFHGAQPNERVAKAMSQASVMVVPSRIGPRNQTEGLPTVIVEAFAHERPVIASRLTGIPEIVVDGVTGWLFEVDDVSGLARSLEEVQSNPQEARRRATRGRDLVVSEFDQSKNAGALLSMIDSFVEARRWE
ncbi:glycosyltransferase family 4 protein [Microvirga calopogonii]|uniref:glycosyltransferase family 4 protein n=1 Tax=Microvirga calopogonii TaxID=2078013 RepID=UPI0013B3ABF8|nr:glycosyltransferase family 4 protein [Microvirga calopogonii]